MNRLSTVYTLQKLFNIQICFTTQPFVPPKQLHFVRCKCAPHRTRERESLFLMHHSPIVIRHQQTLSVSRRFIYFSPVFVEFVCPLIVTCQLYSYVLSSLNPFFPFSSHTVAHRRSCSFSLSLCVCVHCARCAVNNLTWVSLVVGRRVALFHRP